MDGLFLLTAIGVAIAYTMRQFYLAGKAKGREIDESVQNVRAGRAPWDYGED